MNNSSYLKISQVHSSELNDNSEQSFLRVKTPSQLNESSVKLEDNMPQRQFVVKRLGNTTIRQTNPSKVGEALQAQIKRMFQERNKRIQRVPPKVDNRLPEVVNRKQSSKALPVSPRIGLVGTDPRDIQIYDMKKMLQECQEEATKTQATMRRMTLLISEVLRKLENFENKPAVLKQKSPVLQPTPRPAQRLVATKSTAPRLKEMTFRLPIFPIRTLNTLKKFESDLKTRQFNEIVFQKILSICSRVKLKSSEIMPFVFQSILNVNVLSNFVWDSADPNTNPLYFKNFVKFQTLYLKVVNAITNNLYGRNIYPQVVEKFLRAKILTQEKIKQDADKKLKKTLNKISTDEGSSKTAELQLNLNKQIQSSREPATAVNPTSFLECTETLKTQTSSNEENLDENKIQWLEDDKLDEDETENEMESLDGQDDSSNPMDADSHNLESVLDENDFEFLDC